MNVKSTFIKAGQMKRSRFYGDEIFRLFAIKNITNPMTSVYYL